jgi:hypothetical protein
MPNVPLMKGNTMKALALFSLLFALPLAADAGFDRAAQAAGEAFLAEYESRTGSRPVQGPLGFRLVPEDGEMEARVYHVENGRLSAFDYHCHAHGSDLGCHSEGNSDLGAYTRSSTRYSFAEMITTVRLAVEYFTGRIAPESSIQQLTAWEAQRDVHFTIDYQQNGQSQSAFLSCHFHGGHMDCHRKRAQGPAAPESR